MTRAMTALPLHVRNLFMHLSTARFLFPNCIASRAFSVVMVAAAVCRPCVAQPVSPGRVIHLLVQTDPGMKAFEVGNKFVTARDSTSGCSFIEHSVDPVDPESYLLISSIIRQGALKATSIKDDPTGVLIEPLKGQDGTWWIDLRDASRFLDSATVATIDGETQQEEIVELEVAPRLSEQAPLRFHSPGAYILRLEKGKHPRSATLRVAIENLAGDLSAPEDVKVGWPDLGRCYLVTLKGVTGDEQRLFASLQDSSKVGNPIKELYASTATLIVGSFREKDPWLRPGFVSVTYVKPANTNPKRVWMRFPLTEAEEASVLEELDSQLAPEDGFKKLPAWLASRRLRNDEKLIHGQDKWIEIPWDAVEGGFRIDVPIDTRAWKALLASTPEKVGDRAVLVWEFENPKNSKDREALRVGGAGGHRYQTDRLGWWVSGLPTAPLEDR
jgi:hypothetical protein